MKRSKRDDSQLKRISAFDYRAAWIKKHCTAVNIPIIQYTLSEILRLKVLISILLFALRSNLVPTGRKKNWSATS